MNLMRFRKILRTLTPAQRRQWAQMKARFPEPRVRISSAHVPRSVARTFAYVRDW